MTYKFMLPDGTTREVLSLSTWFLARRGFVLMLAREGVHVDPMDCKPVPR